MEVRNSYSNAADIYDADGQKDTCETVVLDKERQAVSAWADDG
jgi:hypothetical protein